MITEDEERRFTKELIHSIEARFPITLDVLNTAVVVCLAGYVIAREKIDKTALRHDFDRELSDWQAGQILKELHYAVIYPHAGKELRAAVEILLEGRIPPAALAVMMEAVIYAEPGAELLGGLVDRLAADYYPKVIKEPVGTPASVNRLCMAVLNPTAGSFYDGVSGVGSTCIAAGRHAGAAGGGLEIFAQEKMPALSALLTVRAYMNGLEPVTARSGDVLCAPAFVRDDRVEQFDYAVMFPPLGASWSSIEWEIAQNHYHRFPYAFACDRSNADWLYVEHLLASLKEERGRGVIGVSTGALFNAGYAPIRRRLVESGRLECVITLPSKILPFTAAPLSLLVLNKAKKKNSAVLMVQADGLFDKDSATRVADQLNDRVIEELVSICESREEKPGISQMVGSGELRQKDCLLLPSRYIQSQTMDTAFGRVSLDFYRMQFWPTLSSRAERIFRGLNISQMAEENEAGGHRIINYADIRDGELDSQGLKAYDVKGGAEKYAVRQGDVLVSCKGAVIKTCIVPETADGALLSLNFIGIRLRKDCDPRFIKYCLDSPMGQAYLKSRQIGTSIVTLKNRDLEEMPIPDLALDKQKAYISAFEDVQTKIFDQILDLYRRLNQEKWQLYEDLGLGEAMTKGKDEQKNDSSGRAILGVFRRG